MELNRKDFVYLKLLYKRKCTSFFQSLTLAEIMDVTGTAKVTTYRNLQKLCKHEYIKKEQDGETQIIILTGRFRGC